MTIPKRVFATCLATLICVVFLQSSVSARQKKPRITAAVFVVSATTIIPENNSQLDLELDIDQELGKSIHQYLRHQKLFAAATPDTADYILEYNLEKVEVTWRTSLDVNFLLRRRDGGVIFTEKIQLTSRRWIKCVKETSSTIGLQESPS